MRATAPIGAVALAVERQKTELAAKRPVAKALEHIMA